MFSFKLIKNLSAHSRQKRSRVLNAAGVFVYIFYQTFFGTFDNNLTSRQDLCRIYVTHELLACAKFK